MRRRSGFTLTELVVTLAVLGMVTFFLTEVLVRQSRTYTVVDDVSETQQSLRAVTGLIERELRMTGFMVPAGAAVCGWDMPSAAADDVTPDVLYVTDVDAIDPTGLRDAELQYAEVDGGFSGTGVDTLNLSTVVVDPPGDPDKGYYDLDDDGVGDSDFLWDDDPPALGAPCDEALEQEAVRTADVEKRSVTAHRIEDRLALRAPSLRPAAEAALLAGIALREVALRQLRQLGLEAGREVTRHRRPWCGAARRGCCS
jgi:prepilin-type N-terminal cleavage/methylation domain-containing protein